MRKIALIKFGYILLVLSLLGCGSSSSSMRANTGSISAKLDWSQIAAVSTNKRVASVPSNVVTVRIIVSGPDMADIQKDFPASQGEGVIDGVPVGSGRVVIAQGLNSGGTASYEGLKGAITVDSGQTTDIGTVTISLSCNNLVKQGNFAAARNVCVNTATAYGDMKSSPADEARFLAAFTRAGNLLLSTQSNGNATTVADVLVAFGCDTSTGRITCPSPLPSSAPTGLQLQTFLSTVIRPELEGAIQDLSKISQPFSLMWTEPFGGKQVKSDYGDVLTFRATAEFLLGSISIENGYDLNANISDFVNRIVSKEVFFASNPDFLKLVNTSELSSAKTLWGNALDDTITATKLMQSRTDNQSNYFISLGNMPPGNIDNTINNIKMFKASLTGPTNIYDTQGRFDATLDLSKFFAGVDLRGLLPKYSGNIPGFFPDPTFDGIWTNYAKGSREDPNHDFNGDGVPDILRKKVSNRQSAGQKSGSILRLHSLR